jgi:hypothetical protein
MTILPITYLGGVEWFSRLVSGGGDSPVMIDTGENWVKQTSRNRAEILTANGVASLTVPVHGYGAKIPAREVRIDNSKRWQHVHWTSIVSAYAASPFFDHYGERFAPIYERRFDWLVDLDLELLDVLTGALKLKGAFEISENYIVARPGDLDLRGKKALRRHGPGISVSGASMIPSGGQPLFKEYIQVFSDRIPFIPGLSIIDLLFCEGPSAREFLY